MMDAAFWWLPKSYGHLQRPDRQITLHPVADCPADYPSGMEVKNDCKVESSLPGSNIANISGPFLIGYIRIEVSVQ